jgi:hypothetical protein
MGQLKMFGKELEIINNPALKSMWGDLMGEADQITDADLAKHPLVSGAGESPDPGPKPTVLQQIRNRFPQLVKGAVDAVKELEEQRLPAEKIVVRGDFVSAQTPALYGYRSSRTFRIV